MQIQKEERRFSNIKKFCQPQVEIKRCNSICSFLFSSSINDVVEARRGQTHLGTVQKYCQQFETISDIYTSQIVLEAKVWLWILVKIYEPFQNLSFFLTYQVYSDACCTCKRCIPNVSNIEFTTTSLSSILVYSSFPCVCSRSDRAHSTYIHSMSFYGLIVLLY